MDDGIDWDLLAKYVSGEASAEEEAQVRAWVAESSEREAFLQELREVWQATDAPGIESSTKTSWDVDRIWRRVEKETSREPAPTSGPPESSRPGPSTESTPDNQNDRAPRQRGASSRRSSRSFVTRRVAAGLILVAAVALVALWGYEPFGHKSGRHAEAKTETFVTEEGQRAKVRLNDGTLVHLNVDSRLVVAKEFGPARRKVRLEGEAFFEVVKDSTRPFIVRTAETTTRVLGTAFDVSAYLEDEETKVVVREGRVAMSPVDSSSGNESSIEGENEGAGTGAAVVLGKGQIARLLRAETKILTDSGALATHLDWMKGKLVFDDAPFPQAVRKLERWYGLTITLKEEGGTSPDGHLNAQFDEDQGLEEVLDVVATAFGLEFERPDPDRVIFYFSSPSAGLHGSQSAS